MWSQVKDIQALTKTQDLRIQVAAGGWRLGEFMLSCNQPVAREIYCAVVRDLLQSMAEKPKRQPYQEAFDLAPYFQPLLFDDEEEEEEEE